MQYTGRISTLYKLYIKNFILSILTLGFYRFYGKTNIRKYIFSHFEYNRSPLLYHGTGGELLKGFFKGLLFMILIIPGSLIPYIDVLAYIFIYLALFCSYYMYIRYVLSRLSLNGIYFAFLGKLSHCLKQEIALTTKNILTFFMLSNKIILKKYSLTYDNISYGNLKSRIDVNPDDIRKIHFITLALSIPTLFLSRIYFHYYVSLYVMKNFYLGNIKILATYTIKNKVFFDIKNLLILIFSFGLGSPYIRHRTLIFIAKNYQVIGDLNACFDETLQNQSKNNDILGDFFNGDVI